MRIEWRKEGEPGPRKKYKIIDNVLQKVYNPSAGVRWAPYNLDGTRHKCLK